MRTRNVAPILGIVVAAAIGGCGHSGPPAGGPPAARQRDDLAKKLNGMTPEQRVQYFKEHPEASRVLSGVPTAPGQNP